VALEYHNTTVVIYGGVIFFLAGWCWKIFAVLTKGNPRNHSGMPGLSAPEPTGGPKITPNSSHLMLLW